MYTLCNYMSMYMSMYMYTYYTHTPCQVVSGIDCQSSLQSWRAGPELSMHSGTGFLGFGVPYFNTCFLNGTLMK